MAFLEFIYTKFDYSHCIIKLIDFAYIESHHKITKNML